jgi:hypothetical protein
MLRLFLLLLLVVPATADELTGCHYIAPALMPGETYYQAGVRDGIAFDPVQKLTGQPRTAPIYIRRIKIYIWGGRHEHDAPYGGWACVQINRPTSNYVNGIGVVAASIGQGYDAIDDLDFGEHSLKLMPGETLLLEGACMAGQVGIQPVVDVYWTETP